VELQAVWPTPQDYNEAVQQPRLCFDDEDLKRSAVELNNLGLPKPITGAFASVYKLTRNSSQVGQTKTWAVRCFLEHRPDIKERYDAIASAIKDSERPLFAGFQFLDKGIKVKGEWYPILKMEWVEGESLDSYVDQHVRNRLRIINLHKQFRELVLKLRRAGIAHGDLQHGNILVTASGLKLIDYDGMFVPALAGRGSPELGHRNYQHPLRSNEFFSEDLDNLSCWVIDSALKLLVLDPELWFETNRGDDSLLFRYSDLNDPGSSPLFAMLTSSQTREIQSSGELLRKLLSLAPDRVPDLFAEQELIDKLAILNDIKLIYNEDALVYDRLATVSGDGDGNGKNGISGSNRNGAPDGIVDGKNSDPSAKSSLKADYDLIDGYDRWLSSAEVGKRRKAARYSRSVSLRLLKSMRRALRKWARFALSHLAPHDWIVNVLDDGDNYFDDGNYTEAVRSYNEIVDFFQDYKERHKPKEYGTAGLRCEIYFKLGYCYVEKNQLGQALHYFSQAERLLPKKIPS
jgi:Mn2+-dependent serine/threonine protein kinase